MSILGIALIIVGVSALLFRIFFDNRTNNFTGNSAKLVNGDVNQSFSVTQRVLREEKTTGIDWLKLFGWLSTLSGIALNAFRFFTANS